MTFNLAYLLYFQVKKSSFYSLGRLLNWGVLENVLCNNNSCLHDMKYSQGLTKPVTVPIEIISNIFSLRTCVRLGVFGLGYFFFNSGDILGFLWVFWFVFCCIFFSVV